MKNSPSHIALFARVIKNPLPFQFPTEYHMTAHKSAKAARGAAKRGNGIAFELDSFSGVNELPDAARSLVSGDYRAI